MLHDQIATLTTSGESETLEFKETTGTRREAGMTVPFRPARVDRNLKDGISGPSQRRETVITLLKRSNNGFPRREIIARLGHALSERQLRRVLEELRNAGLIDSSGRGRSSNRRYTGTLGLTEL